MAVDLGASGGKCFAGVFDNGAFSMCEVHRFALGLSVVAGPVEATAVGNIMVQAMGLGVIRSLRDALSIIKQAFPIREFKPANTVAWDQAYVKFSKMVS